MNEPLSVAMLLDNHYGPDPRVRYECSLLAAAGASTRVIAWDRRALGGEERARVTRTRVGGVDVVRVSAPAPTGGFRPTLRALTTFCSVVWSDRRALLRDVDVLVVHDVYLLPLARLLSGSLRLPYLYDAHEDYATMESDRLPRWWLKAAQLSKRASPDAQTPSSSPAGRELTAGSPLDLARP